MDPTEAVLVEKYPQSNEWRVYVRRTTPNATEEEIHPVHVMFALGIEATPSILHRSVLPQAVFQREMVVVVRSNPKTKWSIPPSSMRMQENGCS